MFVVIVDNLDNDLFSVEELSLKLFMSSSNLNRKVQKLFGFSTLKLVRDLRLQQASELLNIKDKSVNEAAEGAGFYDAAHLSRYFKETFGCSPNDYREINVAFSFIEKLKEEAMKQIDK
ncbi:AraC family transcriptional regulator [[Flexibacter] sp. ATCC 35103]|uniref:helix-turn-helix domain-containing protein n=1 Tax=[Flexibacter] sp. ATCC 35103 TaxID=1937528 RepID=UPI000F4E5F1F|nr:AraC family transcriptional regulator [[Flexibacter] sp. ATCC 35103]